MIALNEVPVFVLDYLNGKIINCKKYVFLLFFSIIFFSLFFTPWELFRHLQACSEWQEVNVVAAGILRFAHLHEMKGENMFSWIRENTLNVRQRMHSGIIKAFGSLFSHTVSLLQIKSSCSSNTQAGDESQLEHGQEQQIVTQDRRFLCV